MLDRLSKKSENLFDKLRNAEMSLTPELMDTIMAATQGVRSMFGELSQASQPRAAQPEVIAALRAALVINEEIKPEPMPGAAPQVAKASVVTSSPEAPPRDLSRIASS